MTAVISKATGAALIGLLSPEIVGTLDDNVQMIMADALSQSTRVWVGMDDGKIAAFWGIMLPTLISDRAYLWLYTTPALDNHKFVFVRQSQVWIKETLKEFPLIVGHALAGEDKSIRWLKWLGAKFLHPEGRLIPFEIRA